MKIKKTVCVLLCVALVVSLCGCRRADDGTSSASDAVVESAVKKGGKVQLLYNYSDTFNPYTSKTALNRQICKLLFDPLVKVNNSYERVFCIAADIENIGRTCTVKLRNVNFSDGTAVTANDVIYSYQAAKKSATEYSYRFYEVASVSALGNNTVVFNLTRTDPYFANLLDFPIIKSGSDTDIDSDGVAKPPVGSGRYTVNDNRNKLSVNTGHYEYSGTLSDIELINAPDNDSVSHYVEVGAADVYYTDFSDGNIVRMSGQKAEVNMNSLVYIGINSGYGELSGQYMRYAISSAIDRKTICNQAYYNNAVAATGFFDPAFEDTASRQTLENKANLEITIENLEQIGYNKSDSSGYHINSAGKHPVFTLLVNSENFSRVAAAKLIAEQLRTAGIEIRLDEKPFDAYKAALETGAFQLYLGEIKFQNNMDISQLVLKGGSAAYGVGAADENGRDTAADKVTPSTSEEADENNSSVSDATAENSAPVLPYGEMLARFYSDSSDVGIGDIAGALLTEMPQIPVCYRLGLVFYDGDSVSCKSACADDIFFGIQMK